MNIPDEYWTTEVPTECGPYMMRIDNGEYVADSVVNVIGFHWEPGEPRKIAIAGGDITPQPVPREAKFCRLTTAAEVDRLKAELQEIGYVRNNDLAELVHLLAQLEQVKAENEKLRGWVEEAYDEGYIDGDSTRVTGEWASSRAKARLEGRSE